MSTLTAEPAARYRFANLVHADALLAEHATLYQPSPNWSGYAAWRARRDVLAAWRDSELARVRTLLCWKCHGTGETGWKHRSGGVCYTCRGDGWSARGRNANR